MEKQKKFAILKGIGLTQVEAEEYFSNIQYSVPQGVKGVETPLEIAYVKEGTLEKLPYLDLNRKEEVWGICIGKVAYRNVHEPDCTLIEASDFAAGLSKKYGLSYGGVSLPSITQFERVTCNDLLYEVTSDILRKKGVMVDSWKDGTYWTNHLYNHKYAYIYEVKTGKNTADKIRDTLHHVRLAISFE